MSRAIRRASFGLLMACVLAAGSTGGSAQAGAQQTPSLQDVYHLTAFRAAPGRFQELVAFLNRPDSGPGAPTFSVVFRHQNGANWDLLLVEHMGSKVELTATPPQSPQAQSPSLEEVAAWHQDTYAAGPPVEQFRRALNLPTAAATPATTAMGLYVISEYQAAPGRRGQMRQVLDQIAGDTPGRAVRLVHMEGAPWSDLMVVRYDSWRQYADENDARPAPGAAAPPERGLELREHMAVHQDTFATVAAVISGPAR